MSKILIIGAGITGILLAKEFTHAGFQVDIWEKSNGVGGRMATRRGDRAAWDHGAQFYTPDGLLEKYHEKWREEKLVLPWPVRSEKPRYYSPFGINALAKNLCSELTIHKNRKLCRLIQNNSQWLAEDEQQQSAYYNEVYLTCPLPQCLTLLENNSIKFSNLFKNISYSKAIVALISSKFDLPEIAFYKESPNNSFFSWTDMKAKGLSEYSAWTIVANWNFSEENWNLPENLILDIFKNEVLKIFSHIKIPTCDWQIKKWHYAQPLSSIPPQDGFISKNPFLVMTGDAFGGGSIAGAARAAQSTFLNRLKL